MHDMLLEWQEHWFVLQCVFCTCMTSTSVIPVELVLETSTLYECGQMSLSNRGSLKKER